MPDTRPPRPYLSREETNNILRILDIEIVDPGVPLDTTINRIKVNALQELLAGAIAEWAGLDFNLENDDPIDGTTPEKVEAELQEWTEEWLFG